MSSEFTAQPAGSFPAQPAGNFTEKQTPADLQRSKELSLERTRPPTEVPGYEAQRFIGSGAYGEVWAGVDRNTGRKVAIKFYAHRRGVDWALLQREVEKLVFLSADRYVVQLLEVGWDGDPPYYVMEFVEQGSLDDLLRKHGTFSAAEAAEMFREIAVGLAHAHGKGVLHCDLKPANILLDQDHRPRLADFGQSRLSNEQRPALGTLFYMAPEQADLEAVPDVRWDVYALGAIFYTLVVGSPPHRNDTTTSQIDAADDLADRLARYRQAIRTAPPPTEHRRRMDKALAEIIDRCLAVNPNDRFANVQEVLDALDARDRARRRVPMMLLGFIGPLIVLLVTAFFSWHGYTRAVENAEGLSRKLSWQGNEQAAHLAAEKVTGEIERLFQIADKEAAAPLFLPKFFEVVDSSPALMSLSDPEAEESEIVSARKAFFNEPGRVALDRYLKERIQSYLKLADRDPRAPRFASIFVTDRLGTQIASAFDEEIVSESIGVNRPNRSYFHGGGADLPPFPRTPQNPRHIERTHLSAVFQSSTQKTWKVAISTPIMRDVDGKQQFEGILVLTVKLGDFKISRSEQARSRDRFAVLVDGREGADRGTILQHPLYDELQAAKDGYIPQAFFDGPEYRVDPELLQAADGQVFEDPLGKYRAASSGKNEQTIEALARQYDRPWLAAAAPVLPPIGAGENINSGLVVLVQSDYQSAVLPSRQLGAQFVKNSFWMLVVMAAVSLGLWYIVVRTFREPRAASHRPAPAQPSATPLHGMTTIAASRKRE
jgi:serine/threonine protein kinase